MMSWNLITACYHTLIMFTAHAQLLTPYCWYLQKPLFVGAWLAAHCDMTDSSSLLIIAHVEQQVASMYNTSIVVTL